MLNLPLNLKKINFKAFLWLFFLSLVALQVLLKPTFAQQLPPSQQLENAIPGLPETGWVEDKDVTFAGQSAIRASKLLEWVLDKYQWSNIPANLQEGGDNPLIKVFRQVQFVVYALLSLMILIGAFVIIISRGQNLTVKKFALRFTLTVALVFLSFAIINAIYAIFDIVQGFFLKTSNGQQISASNLLRVGFADKYKEFIGYRLVEVQFEESVFISTLLVKLTAITYYVMFTILVLRKIIMWFFIVASPIFPLLLLFPAFRNAAKFWAGQFFYWVLYGPLFAMFLFGLVTLWQGGGAGSLLKDIKCDNTTQIFPTATNILLGPPCSKSQMLKFDENNLSNPDTFMLYVISLVMLWVVIFLPFVLLKFFLDYFQNLNVSRESGLMKYLMLSNSPLAKSYRQLTALSSNRSSKDRESTSLNTSSTMSLPTFKHSPVERIESEMAQAASSAIFKHSPLDLASVNGQGGQTIISPYPTISKAPSSKEFNIYSNQPVTFPSANVTLNTADSQILAQTGLTIPRLADIARFETALISEGHPARSEVNNIQNILDKLADKNPNLVPPAEREKFVSIKNDLTNNTHPGSAVAPAILGATKEVDITAIPQGNQIQVVNQADFEKVKDTWASNYKKIDPPKNPDGSKKDRKQWIKEDIDKMQKAIDLLSSKDTSDNTAGKRMISQILPFMMLGGFSNDEIIGYLKAKLDAAKDAMDDKT